MSHRISQSSLSSAINYMSNLQYTGDAKQSRKMMSHRLNTAKYLFRKDLYAHYGCVNAVEFSNDGEWLVSGGDDKRVLIWNIDKTLSNCPRPKAMKGEHNSNIFCLSFDSKHEKIFSAGNDEQVILHDVGTGETSDVFLHDEAVYGLSVDPLNQNIFASACDDGRILIWDIRASSTDAFMLAGYSSAFHAVMHNPVEPRLIATANAKEGVGLWDIRKPRVCLIRYGGSILRQSAMSVRFNSMGTHILSLRRRLPPVLYEMYSAQPVAQFDHREYYNSCTMKSCCFAGDRDEYVLSGSDDFKLYMWKIPDSISSKKGIWVNEVQAVLRGHRSIVNQVRYNYTYGIFASSGVEKIIKLWSTFPITVTEPNYITDMDGLRKVYSHEEYINLVLESGQFMTHDYSHHSMQEDPRMMAFFDSLVQRDIEGWTSDSSETSTTADAKNTCFEVQSAESSSSSSFTDSSSSSSDESNLYNFNPNRTQTQYSSGLNFSTTLCPPMSALLGENNHSDRISESENLTSDKISQLIAKKRHDQMIKSARTTLKLKKRLKRIKRHIRSRVNGTGVHSNPSSTVLDDARTVLTSVIQSRIDKRKLLQKKRAKLLRSSTISDNSSDSDDHNEGTSQSNVNSVVRIDLALDSNLGSRQNGLENGGNTVVNGDVNCVTNGVVTGASIQEVTGDTCVPQCSTSRVNGESSASLPVSLESNSSVFFQPRNGKHHSRNYRKRSADDIQDDS